MGSERIHIKKIEKLGENDFEISAIKENGDSLLLKCSGFLRLAKVNKKNENYNITINPSSFANKVEGFIDSVINKDDNEKE